MRSRDGDCPNLFTGIALILLTTLGRGDDYYIAYRMTTVNSTAVAEELLVSRAMQSCRGTKSEALTLLRLPNETLKQVLDRETTRFLEYASPHTVHLKSSAISINQTFARNQDTLTTPSQCYAVEFNDDSVTIVLIK